jgi:hypothetical protein
MTEEIKVIQEGGWYTLEEGQWRGDMNEEEKITITVEWTICVQSR